MGVATAQASNVLIGAQGTASLVINCPDPSTQTQIWSRCTLDLETGSSEKGRIDREFTAWSTPALLSKHESRTSTLPKSRVPVPRQQHVADHDQERKLGNTGSRGLCHQQHGWRGKAQLPWHCWRCDVLQIALDEAWSPYRPIVVDLLINLNFLRRWFKNQTSGFAMLVVPRSWEKLADLGTSGSVTPCLWGSSQERRSWEVTLGVKQPADLSTSGTLGSDPHKNGKVNHYPDSRESLSPDLQPT